MQNQFKKVLHSVMSRGTVEGLYSKRPIQCLSSSKILTPHTLNARRLCTQGGGIYGGAHRAEHGTIWLMFCCVYLKVLMQGVLHFL
jgi:hypothetical protein